MRSGRIGASVFLFCLLILAFPMQGSANVNARMVNVAVCPHNPPFQFLDQEFRLNGIHIDLLDYIAEQNNLFLNYIPYNTKAECINALNRGVADIVLGYQLQEYDQTEHFTTSELSSGSISIVANKNLAAYIEETQRTTPFTIAFEFGSIDYSMLNSLGFRRLVGVGNQEQAVEALLLQNADTVVGVTESINYLLRQEGDDDHFQTIHQQIGTVRYAILVSQNSPSLYRMLDRALVDLHTSGVYSEIYNQWVPDQLRQQMWMIVHILLIVALCTGLVAAVVLWFNYLLRKKVNLKTGMLSEANYSLELTVLKLQNEAIFRNQMIDSLPIPAILFDSKFAVTLMNPMAQSVCCLDTAGSLNTDARCLPVFGAILRQMGEDIFSPVSTLEQQRVFDTTGESTARKYRCWIHRLVEKDSYAGALMMVEDITQEVYRQQEIFAMEKANTLNKVVAGIAHEIKNPLMTLKTAVSLMTEQWENPKIRDAFVRFIPDEVDRMNSLVQSLLNYSRPPNEEFSVFPLYEVVMRSFHLAEMTDRKSRIQFSVTLDESLYVRGQKDLLRQTLTNLLINSIWAVNEKREQTANSNWTGTISGRAYAEGDWACLSIYDDGVGMSPEVVSHCMDPFFTTKMAGTGLGLALVKQCVENSSGSIAIHSEEQSFTEILIRFPKCCPEDNETIGGEGAYL